MEDDYRKYVFMGVLVFVAVCLITVWVSGHMRKDGNHDYNSDTEYRNSVR